MSGGLRFRLDIPQIISAVDDANDLAVFAMSEQVLKDSNFYCKRDQDGLIDSSITNSDTANGIIKWDTPYAQRQYFLEAAHTDKNPNAQYMWFDKAKDVHLDEWNKVYENAFKRGMRH